MDTAALTESFWQQGYLIIEDFFPDELMDRCQKKLLSHYGMSPQFEHDAEFLDLSATEVVSWFPQMEGETLFDEAENNSDFKALTEAILGEGWRSLYCMSMFSKKGTKGQAWHQDCAPEDPNIFNMNRLVYTHDINEEDGGQVVIIPGSHKRGTISVGQVDEDFPDQLVLTPKKGTLVLLHGHTWHRVFPVNGPFRVSTNFRCVPKGTADSVTDICVYRNMRYHFATKSVVENRV